MLANLSSAPPPSRSQQRDATEVNEHGGHTRVPRIARGSRVFPRFGAQQCQTALARVVQGLPCTIRRSPCWSTLLQHVPSLPVPCMHLCSLVMQMIMAIVSHRFLDVSPSATWRPLPRLYPYYKTIGSRLRTCLSQGQLGNMHCSLITGHRCIGLLKPLAHAQTAPCILPHRALGPQSHAPSSATRLCHTLTPSSYRTRPPPHPPRPSPAATAVR